jgi:sterol desaturase/sphingolipid hydroxylase (fatty acid hydroxylase superfamily)
MERIIGLFVGLGVLSVIFWIIELLFAAKPAQPRLAKRRGFLTDLIYWFATPLMTRSVSAVGLAVILALVYRMEPESIRNMLETRETFVASLPGWIQVLAMLLVGDLIAYWLHRAFHSGRLWRFHAIHHSSQDLDWLSSVRLHPVNDWLTRWIQATSLILLGFAPLVVAAYVPFLSFYAILLHANVSWGFGLLGRIVASPKFHRWHHTAEHEGLDRNFAGLFPVWDQIFGTYFMPKDRLPEVFGLQGESVPESFLGQLLYPFRRPLEPTRIGRTLE